MGEIEYGPYPQHAARCQESTILEHTRFVKASKYLMFQDWLLECDEFGIRNYFLVEDYLELKDSLRKFYRFASNEEFEDYLFARVEERKNKRISDAKRRILEARREITAKKRKI